MTEPSKDEQCAPVAGRLIIRKGAACETRLRRVRRHRAAALRAIADKDTVGELRRVRQPAVDRTTTARRVVAELAGDESRIRVAQVDGAAINATIGSEDAVADRRRRFTAADPTGPKGIVVLENAVADRR